MNAPNFVGRQSDLNQIDEHLWHLMTGQSRVLLLEGLAGIGKTRLIEQIEQRSKLQDINIAVGRSVEDMVQPYAPFRSLLPYFEDEQCIEDCDLSFLPVLGGRVAPAVDTSLSSDTQPEKMFFINATQAVITLTSRRSLILIAEDLHWADPSTLDLFDHLAFALAERPSVPLLLIGTYRPVEPETRLGKLLGRLEPESMVRHLELSGFNEAETRAFLRELGVQRPTQQLVQTVYRATQGLPLFIQEAVHHLIRTGSLVEQDGYFTAAPSALDAMQMPQTLVDAIDSRIQFLPVLDLNLLSQIALIGDDIQPEQLLTLEIASESELTAAIEAGVSHVILVADHAQLSFVHPLIQRALASRLPMAERQRFHHRIALALQRLHADELDAYILEIAGHLMEARALIEPQTALYWFKLAGEQALTMYAWREAAQFYELALNAAQSTPQVGLRDQAALLYQAGLAHQRNQDMGPALARFEEAVQAYREIGDLRSLANAIISHTTLSFMRGTWAIGVLPDVEPLHEVLEALGDTEPALSGYIRVILAQAYLVARQTEQGYNFATQAIDLGLLANDNHICASAYNALGLAFISELRVQDAIESWQAAATYARRTDDLRRYSLPLINLPLASNLRGSLEETVAQAIEGREVAATIQDWSGYSKALSHLVSASVAKGDYRTAEAQANQTLLTAERSQYPWGALRALQALSCASALRGLWDEANQALDMMIEPGRLFTSPSPFVQVLARTFRQLIRTYQSQPLDEDIAILTEQLMAVVSPDTYSLGPLCAVIELGVATYNPAITEQPAAMLSAALERGVVLSPGWSFLLSRSLGLAATLHHDWVRAEAHFQDALRTGFRTGARPELARSYHDYARMVLRKQTNGDDYSYAAELAETARTQFNELDMLPHARAAAELKAAIPEAGVSDDIELLTRLPPSPDSRRPNHP